MAERRSKYEIIYDILEVLQRKGGSVKPTHVLYGGNLSYDRLKKYMQELEENGLIEKVSSNGKTLYKLTDKGYKFLSEYKKVKELTGAFGI